MIRSGNSLFNTKKERGEIKILKLFFGSPPRAAISGFASLIIAGAMLLTLSDSSVAAGHICFTDALFTATSAVCVTGLVVVDTGTYFTLFGQSVILFLIQAGGLGIMTISTFFIIILRKRPSFSGHAAIQDTFDHRKNRNITVILHDVLLFTFALEGLGVIILFFCFFPKYGAGHSFYLALFHSVSAFCNAGFSLFSDSFTGYRNNLVVNLIICFLIIMGGIGFPVLSELKHCALSKNFRWNRLTLHTKLVISSTAFLLLSSTLLIFFMEWDNTMKGFGLQERFLSAFFQAVNARTSGFNSLSIGDMANETLFLLILFMFVGASPGSCGGGIKTTTFSTLTVLGISRFMGQKRPQLFNRSIPEKSIRKAVSVVLISTFVVSTGIMILLMTELGSTSHIQSRGKFLEIFFEVISAFGTVGLSTGVTGTLSTIGKLIITLIMFIGRLGPLLIAVAVSRPARLNYYYAEENIMIG